MALTKDEFRGYGLLFWKLGLLDEEQFDLLMAEYDKFVGKSFKAVTDQLEAELRQAPPKSWS